MRDLERFEVLTIAKDLALRCYQLTRDLPKHETYGLSSQIRRASVSVAANIAEGLGRGTQGELEHHLRIALGSAAELQVLLDLTSHIYSIDPGHLAGVLEGTDAVRRKLNRLTSQVASTR